MDNGILHLARSHMPLKRMLFDSCPHIYLTQQACHAKGLKDEIGKKVLIKNVNKVMLSLEIALLHLKRCTH
jgi:hypothetical protein